MRRWSPAEAGAVSTMAFVLSLFVFSMAAAGCAGRGYPEPAVAEQPPEALPADPVALLDVAHGAYRLYGPREDVARSLAAARRVLEVYPDSELAHFQLARAALWLLEYGDERNSGERRRLAAEGFRSARAALAAGGERVEYVFLSGALLGYRIRHSAVPSLVELREVRKYFTRAVELDPTYDNGAPLGALGTLLVRAPAWPAGCGDVEEGITYLLRVVELFPGKPTGHYFLAEALRESGDDARATAAYRLVLSLCEEPRWGAICDRYAPLAREALAIMNGASPASADPASEE